MSAQVSPMLSTDELLGRIKHAYRKAEDGRATYEKLIPEWYERIGDRQTAASILERELEIGRKWAYKLLPPPPQKPEEKQGDETPQASAATENIEESDDTPVLEPDHVRAHSAFIIRADAAARAAFYVRGKIDEAAISAAEDTAAMWNRLVLALKEGRHVQETEVCGE